MSSNKMNVIKVRHTYGHAGRTLYAINENGTPVFRYPSERYYGEPLSFSSKASKKVIENLQNLGYTAVNCTVPRPSYFRGVQPSKNQLKALQKRARN